MNQEIAFEVILKTGYNNAVVKVIDELKKAGFGVLTRIDVRVTLKMKLEIDFRDYVILGACNPPLAHRALSIDPKAGLMLPCNVTVESNGDDSSIVRIANPEIMLQAGNMADSDEMKQTASEAKQLLEGVARNLENQPV